MALKKAPESLKRVELVFPVTGHSFMPPDRVFAVMEKEIKKRDIFSNHATVNKLDSERCPVYEWKSGIVKIQAEPQKWHFRLNSCKRVIFTRNEKKNQVLVRGECFYRSDSCKPRSIMISGKTPFNIEPDIIPFGHALKASKLKDVKSLLGKHYGNECAKIPFLSFYTKVLDIQNVDEEENHEEENEMCVGCPGEDEVVREMRV
ncbi:hypothetical protein J6590_090397 [Homalodisca vitripennis]|nr:hypothetical protein J6590_090397 [Homalodisca vitripennis]